MATIYLPKSSVKEQFYLYETTLLFQTKNYICKKPTNNSNTYENSIYP